MNTIAGEFGGSVPHSLSEYYRGGGLVPNTPTNAAIPTSGTISMGNFYGSANRVAVNLTISGNTNSYDVYANRGPSYVAGTSDVTVTINPGVTVGSTSVPAYAMLVPSAFNPGDTVRIVNNGLIQGCGGAAGNGGAVSITPSPQVANPGGAGSGGGSALYVNRPTVVTNNGTIASGGGGGGGGGAIRYVAGKNQAGVSGSGGGGGSGSTGGAAGSAGPRAPAPLTGVGNAGSAGTSPAGGGGGPSGSRFYPNISNTTVYGGAGGAGGGRGAAGSTGGTGFSSPPIPAPVGTAFVGSGGGGGAAGNYIVGNPFVTWPVTGTRQGNVA